MILKPLTRFSKVYNRFRYFWLVFMVFMMCVNAIVSLFAEVGLSEVQKQLPTAFHGHYLNFHNLWLFMAIWIPLSLGFTIISCVSLYTHRLPDNKNVGVSKE